MPHSVLVVGAGPTGLAMAAELARHGVPCRIIDKAVAPTNTSKAIVVQARTLEIFSLMQLAGEFVAAGNPVHAVNIYSSHRRILRIGFDELDSPFPYVLVIPQPETERILTGRLRQLGVTVERGVELIAISQDTEKATVELRHTDGRTEHLRTDWVIACDGPHSAIRRALDIPFKGHTFEQIFVLADVHATSSLSEAEAHLFSHRGNLCAIFPLGGGRHRLIADNPPDDVTDQGPSLEQCQAMVNERVNVPVTLNDATWTSTFRINSRMVAQLRAQRVFLAGDAAHIHSPAGGQGMNTGIQDAVNLAWKLALVSTGRSDPSILDSYQTERYPVERAVLQQTDAAFRIAGSGGGVAAFLREHVLPIVGRIDAVGRAAARRVSETDIEYEHSSIVEDHYIPHAPRAGDRAPDAIARLAPDGREIRILDVCSRPQHTLLLVTGTTADVALAEECSRQVVASFGDAMAPVIISDSTAETARQDHPADSDAARARSLADAYGPSRPALYLVRPDGYIGFRAPLTNTADSLMQYLRRIMPHHCNS